KDAEKNMAFVPEDPVARYKRRADEREARIKAEREREEQHQVNNAAAWTAYIEEKVAAEHQYLVKQLLPTLVAGLQDAISAEIAEQIGQLRAEMTIAKAHPVAREKPRDGTDKAVIDLPGPFLRKRA